MDHFVKQLVRGSEKEKRNENEESDNDSRASALASSDTTQSPIAAGNTAMVTDEDTAVVTSLSINKQPSTQIAVVYKELLSESDDPANRLERQSRIKRGPYQPKLSLFP
jgi:hypothetical protein